MGDREQRVKDEAYRVWDEAGRPEGRDDEHWYEAEKRVAAGEAEAGGKPKKPKAVKPLVKSAGAVGVAVPVANDEPKARPRKGLAVEIGVARPKKAKAGAAEKPGKDKPSKDKAAKPKPKS